MVRLITTIEELQAEFDNAENENKLIVLDFFATWCGPCMCIAPKIENWSNGEFQDKAVFLKCDVDQSEELSQYYNIEAMPTFVLFKDGEEIGRIVGANVAQLKADIENHTD